MKRERRRIQRLILKKQWIIGCLDELLASSENRELLFDEEILHVAHFYGIGIRRITN
jgi:hypothetical protein